MGQAGPEELRGWHGNRVTVCLCRDYLEMSLPPRKKRQDPGAWQLGLSHVYTFPSKFHHTVQEKEELNRMELYHMDVFIFVLQSKCPAESIDSSGKTALHYAGNCHSFICRLLP